jgi:DNA-binding IclR family transcriptional regulator
MSQTRLLALVARYPHLTALARNTRCEAVYPGLRTLERRGFVRRDRDQYRLTRRGRDELAMARAIARLLRRSELAAP